MISSLLYDLNHAPIWHRELKVWGQRFRATSLDRVVFLMLQRAGIMGAGEARLLQKLTEEGMQVVDIGANIGLYTLLFAKRVEKAGRVFAFEPEPDLFAALCDNCAANDVLNVSPFQIAAGDSNGRANFQRSIFNSGDNRLGATKIDVKPIEVEVARLDDLLPVRNVQFIKLDVQGHELAALAGMQEVIASSPDVRVFFEFWPGGLRAANTPPESLLSFFRERGFKLYTTKGGVLRSLRDSQQLISDLGTKQYTNLLATRNPVEIEDLVVK
jgi:FkbM family methyltransferase